MKDCISRNRVAYLDHASEFVLKLRLFNPGPVGLSLAERVLPVHGRHVLLSEASLSEVEYELELSSTSLQMGGPP